MNDQPKLIVAGWAWVPYDAIASLDEEKRRLTYVPRFADKANDPDPNVRLFRDLPDRQYLGVPRAYGMARFAHLPIEDRRVMGAPFLAPVPRLPDPNHPSVKEPERQAQFMRDMEATARADGNFLAFAPTGSGKTVVALRTAAVLGRKTIILVHLERLMEQWVEEIKSKLGVPESRIGFAQGERCDFADRDFVVAMMHSNAQRQYPVQFYNAFGTTIYDECHRVGSPMLSLTAPLFPSFHRIGLSATPKREDGGDRVFFWHIGPIKVRSQATALPMKVYAKSYRSKRVITSRNHGAIVKQLTLDPARNDMLANMVKRFYNANRQVLAIGDHVPHIQEIMERCVSLGIPRSAMGQFTGERHIIQPVLRNGKLRQETVRKVKIKSDEYERIKKDCQIIFATYGVFSEGIDVPRLDAGIELTPRGKATQVIGRVRRPHPNKPDPFWVTIVDTHSFMCVKYFEKRKADYRETGAQLVINRRV